MECPKCNEPLVLTTKQVKTDKVIINNIPAWGCLDCRISFLNKEINSKVNEFKLTKEGEIDFQKEIKRDLVQAKKEADSKNKARKTNKLGEVKKDKLKLDIIHVKDGISPVCPSCQERDYRIQDHVPADEEFYVIFYAKCNKCRTVFPYKKSILDIFGFNNKEQKTS